MEQGLVLPQERPVTQTLLSLLHLPCLPRRIKLDIQGGKREGEGERGKEGGQGREGETRKKAQAGIYFLCLDKGKDSR